MARNVIITGGAGFVASHLADSLVTLEIVDKIYLLDNLVRTNGLRNINHLLKTYPNKVEFVHGDVSIFDFSTIPDVMQIFHLAATRINRCVKYPLEGHVYSTDGGFNIVQHCAKNNISLYFASSASVYDSPRRFPIHEDDPCRPPTLYGSSKLYTEHLILNFHKMTGLKYGINRYFSVYGPRMDSEGVYTEVIFNWLNNIKNGNNNIVVYGNPAEKVLDLVHVYDVVNAILQTSHKNNVFNVSTQQGVTLEQLIQTIETVTNTKLNVEVRPENRTDIENKRIGSTERLRNVGWAPLMSLEAGIKDTYEWITSLE
jgi:UDP-glucose 4-epimerase